MLWAIELHRDRRGAAAVIFALSVMPLLGVLGLAVDATLYVSGKERLDAWVEAACERAEGRAIRHLSFEARRQAASDLFEANARDVAAAGEELDLSVGGSGAQLELDGRYRLHSIFGRLFGVENYEARSSRSCELGVYTGGTITFVFRDRESVRRYKVVSNGPIEIRALGGDASYAHWLEFSVTDGASGEDLAEEALGDDSRDRIGSHDADPLVIESTARDLEIEVRVMASNGLALSRELPDGRVEVEDGVDTDYNDAYYEFTADDGSKILQGEQIR